MLIGEKPIIWMHYVIKFNIVKFIIITLSFQVFYGNSLLINFNPALIMELITASINDITVKHMEFITAAIIMLQLNLELVWSI